jgi:hypothetical protein
MSTQREYFEERAEALSSFASFECIEDTFATTLKLVPHRRGAVGVVLHLFGNGIGTFSFDDQASAPAELGSDDKADILAINRFIEDAREGYVTAFHIGRGGCIEVTRPGERTDRTWKDCVPLPGWRHRAQPFEYGSYG